jgi:amino acid permease
VWFPEKEFEIKKAVCCDVYILSTNILSVKYFSENIFVIANVKPVQIRSVEFSPIWAINYFGHISEKQKKYPTSLGYFLRG